MDIEWIVYHASDSWDVFEKSSSYFSDLGDHPYPRTTVWSQDESPVFTERKTE